jgi:putative FmdB family regulatory protein
MPLYEYICEKCGKITAEIKSVDERLNCPECKCGAKMVLKISASRLKFTGTGFQDRLP